MEAATVTTEEGRDRPAPFTPTTKNWYTWSFSSPLTVTIVSVVLRTEAPENRLVAFWEPLKCL